MKARAKRKCLICQKEFQDIEMELMEEMANRKSSRAVSNGCNNTLHRVVLAVIFASSGSGKVVWIGQESI